MHNMTDLVNTMDALTASVVDLSVKGLSFEDIAEREGITVHEAVRAWKSYVDNRAVRSHEDWLLLHELRLERLLQMAFDRLQYAQTDDMGEFKTMMEILDRIEKLKGLNKERKAEAIEVLARINEVQSQIILGAFEIFKSNMQRMVTSAIENNKTIKAIKAEVSDVFDTKLLPVAQEALMGAGSGEEA